jgi:hypothetical protein
VDTDVLVQFLFQARPAERGLAKYEDEVRLWFFPPDYPKKANRAIEHLKIQGFK